VGERGHKRISDGAISAFLKGWSCNQAIKIRGDSMRIDTSQQDTLQECLDRCRWKTPQLLIGDNGDSCQSIEYNSVNHTCQMNKRRNRNGSKILTGDDYTNWLYCERGTEYRRAKKYTYFLQLYLE